ncbi:MAG: flagella basal body P-ring formation protein FlgA [Asticcacaulis sp.]
MTIIKTLLCGFAGLLAASLLLSPALAMAQTSPNTLVLKSNVTDSDGRITIGDVFDNAGSAADIVLGYRHANTAVLDAANVQSIAARAGVYWVNSRGLRRIIVAAGVETGSNSVAQSTHVAPQSPSDSHAFTLPAANQTVVKRSEMVSVVWSQNGLTLSVTGQAQKDGGIGDVIQIQNPSSKKMFEAVVTGPGQAVVGPAADQFRNQMLLSSR